MKKFSANDPYTHTSKINRLKRKQAAVQHIFKSNWYIWVEYPNASKMSLENVDNWKDNFLDAKEFAEKEWNNDKNDLIEYAQEKIPTITDITLELTPKNVITTVSYNEEPTTEIINATKEYLTEQFSDGFGESLEQYDFASFNHEDEDDDGYTYVETGYLYVKLWNDTNWSIK